MVLSCAPGGGVYMRKDQEMAVKNMSSRQALASGRRWGDKRAGPTRVHIFAERVSCAVFLPRERRLDRQRSWQPIRTAGQVPLGRGR